MKVALISDTHDNTAAVSWIISYLNQHNIQVALHAGDLVYPGIIRRFRDNFNGVFHFVFGNNDGELSVMTQLAAETNSLVCHNREMKLELAGNKLFMNHYSELSEAVAAIEQYDISIGGHDHQYRVKNFGKTLFINPGTTLIQDTFSESPNTILSFAVLNLEEKTVEQIVLPPIYLAP